MGLASASRAVVVGSVISWTIIFLPQHLLLSSKSPSPEKRLGAVTRSRLNVPYLFSYRQVTNITTPAVHDAADATRCSQKERKCIFKVRGAQEPSTFSHLGKESLAMFVCWIVFREGGIALAASATQV